MVLATLLVHTGAVLLGSLRACWADGHTHAGGAAECPMHARPEREGTQAVHRGHHAHGGSTAGVPHESEQMTCRCSNDPASPYLGVAGIVTAAVSVARPADAAWIPAEHELQPPEVPLPVHSPPPRSASSSRS
ncbi:MAG: hypothetical protein HY655_07965 [Acidobacteria bacterium]|nr:hypothetical protein [Acidobacteriota bacterium]